MHFEDERDADEAIRALNGAEWGRQNRRLRVEFAKNDANVRAREAARRSAADPNTTLFVAGFDARSTREADLEKSFEPFGRLKVRIDWLGNKVQQPFYIFTFYTLALRHHWHIF